MAVSATLVRELRESTGAGMMDCKKALEATGGDLQAALDHLRKAGTAKAEKKASRSMGEGRVFAEISADGRVVAAIAITCETDFVAKTDDFLAFGRSLCEHVLANEVGSLEDLLTQPLAGGASVEQSVKQLIGRLGENMSVGRVCRLSNAEGWVAAYVHHDGRHMGVASVTTSAKQEDAAAELKALCMHIVFNATPALTREELDSAEVERERAIFLDQVKDKPEEIQEKIINGKLNSYFASRVLPEQPWIHENSTSVAQALKAALGADAEVQGFAYFKVGG